MGIRADSTRALRTAPRMVVTSNGGIVSVAGAQLSQMDEDFAAKIGAEPGVLVVHVPAGSLAAQAGLRSGETIHAVNGVPVRSLAAVTRAFGAPGVHAVALTVHTRNAAPRIVTVRW
jgi:S1-C subfamily serine protease